MIGTAVLAEARIMIGDIATEEANRRQPVANMVKYLNNAIQDLLMRRPELALADDGTLTAFTELTTTTVSSQALPVDEDYREALAHNIAAQIFQIDANDEHNAQQALSHEQVYLSLI